MPWMPNVIKALNTGFDVKWLRPSQVVQPDATESAIDVNDMTTVCQFHTVSIPVFYRAAVSDGKLGRLPYSQDA